MWQFEVLMFATFWSFSPLSIFYPSLVAYLAVEPRDTESNCNFLDFFLTQNIIQRVILYTLLFLLTIVPESHCISDQTFFSSFLEFYGISALIPITLLYMDIELLFNI